MATAASPTVGLEMAIRLCAVLIGILCLQAEGQEPGYIVSMSVGPLPQTGLYYVPPNGGTAIQLARPRVLPAVSVMGPSMAQLPGNRHILVDESYSTGYNTFSYHVFDRLRGSYDPLPLIPPIAQGVFGTLVIDQEGDLILAASGSQTSGVYRLGRDGSYRNVASFGGLSGEVLVDLDTGDYVVCASPAVLRVSPGGSVFTIGNLAGAIVQAQDPESGEYLVWAPDGVNLPSRIHRMAATGVVTSTNITAARPVGTAVDETPSVLGEYVYCSFQSYIARASRAGGMSTILQQFPGFCVDMIMDSVQSISTTNAGLPNKWNLLIGFSHDRGYPYIVLVGVSGYRAGITLQDQRRIRLNPDGVTVLGASGGLQGFTGLLGTLDSLGNARGMIDLSAVGPAARGLPFWMVGLVLDPAAPSGIRRISPPVVVQIR